MAKEIDFDELDRAVSSLMGSMKKDDPSTSQTAPATHTPTSPTPVSNSPASPPIPSSAPEKPAQPSIAPPLPVKPEVKPPTTLPRRAGRFMDVVHPSADMQSRSVTPPSREGIAITPRPSLSLESSPDTTKEVKTPLVPARSTIDTMPDPISLSESTSRLAIEPAPQSTKPDLQKPALTREEKEEPASVPANSESPFLANAKVEKRPLGNEPPTGSDLKAPAPTDEQNKEKEEGADGDSALPQTQSTLPAELTNDLVTIESKELTTHVPAAARVKKEDPVPSGPTSISQQYKEQPSSGDSEHAPIYDAEQIPQPLTHPPKKKAGWLWIIWVVLLLVLGAGGAAVLYATGIIP